MSKPSGVLVVGASAAGLATAEALRRKGYTGELTLLGEESRRPYDRPPLSKQVLAGAWSPDRAQLRSEDVPDALGARFVLGDPAVALDVPTRTVSTAGGLALRADAAVVADNLLGEQRFYAPVPYYWTDQFDARIHVHGVPTADADVTVVEGDLASRRFVALYHRDGDPVAVLGWNMPKQARQHRQSLLGEPRVPHLSEGRR
ncbi:oxidoreductase C-terminal domain-containing protein [Allokutzneria oryzae]|uniref:Oxidoreductase C-terminal domain-containing protein n=1 Tax=Allokutzneria oryzae TaxID=1378989 RepID=A0ABV6A8Z0_9PSEU